MLLKVDALTVEVVRLSAHDGISPLLWGRVRGFFPNQEPEGGNAFRIPFYEFVRQLHLLRDYCEGHDIPFIIVPDVQTRIDTIERTKQGGHAFSEEELEERLQTVGFERPLMSFQTRNVRKLCQRLQGASFSVPGAGKTTEALAFYFALRSPGDTLLVVAPKNAFCAWEEQLAECVPDLKRSFVRLVGGIENVRKLLREQHDFLLINYQSLGRYQKAVAEYLTQSPGTFVFLDESHRAKNPRSQTAEAIRAISVFPKGRLVMSGTPMPQAREDLVPQVSFLYPDEEISVENAVERIQPIYVRTTAGELGIPDIKHLYRNVQLPDIEMEAYKRMRLLSAKALTNPNPTDARFLRNLGKSVTRLLAFVANPSTLANEMAQIDPRLPAYLASHDGPKISYVCRRTRELVTTGKKVLIWSAFVKNVELLAARLADCGADYIHGGVQAGSDEDEGTRERKIKRFHEEPSAMVLVANPAAASEGISLHKDCQYAIYLDRSFNAAHFLQSQDRIHRIGMPTGTFPTVEIIQCPDTIDEVVDLRLKTKIMAMSKLLNDPSIIVGGSVLDDYDEDEENGEGDVIGLSPEDCESILAHLQSL